MVAGIGGKRIRIVEARIDVGAGRGAEDIGFAAQFETGHRGLGDVPGLERNGRESLVVDERVDIVAGARFAA